MRQEMNYQADSGDSAGVPIPGKVKVVAVRAERGVKVEPAEQLYDVLAEELQAQDPERWDGLS